MPSKFRISIIAGLIGLCVLILGMILVAIEAQGPICRFDCGPNLYFLYIFPILAFGGTLAGYAVASQFVHTDKLQPGMVRSIIGVLGATLAMSIHAIVFVSIRGTIERPNSLLALFALGAIIGLVIVGVIESSVIIHQKIRRMGDGLAS